MNSLHRTAVVFGVSAAVLAGAAPAHAAADSTTAQRIFTVSGEAWCDTAPPNPQSLPVPCGKVTIYGNGFSAEATPAPLGSVVPVQGTFRIENVPGGNLYKIDAETRAGPFVARPVHCTEEVDLRDEQFIIGDSYWMFMEPWSWFDTCKTPPSS